MRSIRPETTDVHASVPVARVLARLDHVRRCGSGWVARCPCSAHADQVASLSIGQGGDGRCLLHCFGGCRVTDVLEALNLRMADFFIASRERRVWRG